MNNLGKPIPTYMARAISPLSFTTSKISAKISIIVFDPVEQIYDASLLMKESINDR